MRKSNECEIAYARPGIGDNFGANTVLMLQIELTHTIADLWYKENK